MNDNLHNRISKALEDVHRKMAMQEFRRKRDRMALDCVRLGKITYHRTVSVDHIQIDCSTSFISCGLSLLSRLLQG